MIREVEMYKALGEDTRLRIMRIMVKAERELCACEIIDILEKPQYTISKSLGVLVSTGILSERREGRMMFYRMKTEDAFVSALLESVAKVSEAADPVFKEDAARMKIRIAKRKNGKCVDVCGK